MIEVLAFINILFILFFILIITLFDFEYILSKYDKILKTILIICICVLFIITLLRPFLFQSKEFKSEEMVTYNQIILGENDYNIKVELENYQITIKKRIYTSVKPFGGVIYWINNPSQTETKLVGIFKTNPMELQTDDN